MGVAPNRLGKIDLVKARLIIVEVARCLRLAAPGTTHPFLWGAAALILTENLPRRAGLAREAVSTELDEVVLIVLKRPGVPVELDAGEVVSGDVVEEGSQIYDRR